MGAASPGFPGPCAARGGLGASPGGERPHSPCPVSEARTSLALWLPFLSQCQPHTQLTLQESLAGLNHGIDVSNKHYLQQCSREILSIKLTCAPKALTEDFKESIPAQHHVWPLSSRGLSSPPQPLQPQCVIQVPAVCRDPATGSPKISSYSLPTRLPPRLPCSAPSAWDFLNVN